MSEAQERSLVKLKSKVRNQRKELAALHNTINGLDERIKSLEGLTRESLDMVKGMRKQYPTIDLSQRNLKDRQCRLEQALPTLAEKETTNDN